MEAIQNKLIIGFGYNYARFKNPKDNSIIKHVSFVNSFENDEVEILDYFIDKSGQQWTAKYNKFISSILDVNDGFWILGDIKKINFQLV